MNRGRQIKNWDPIQSRHPPVWPTPTPPCSFTFTKKKKETTKKTVQPVTQSFQFLCPTWLNWIHIKADIEGFRISSQSPERQLFFIKVFFVYIFFYKITNSWQTVFTLPLSTLLQFCFLQKANKNKKTWGTVKAEKIYRYYLNLIY